MKSFIFFFSAAFTLISCHRLPESENQLTSDSSAFRIMFWNAENLFDCFNDSITMDEEYLPYGIRAWNTSRYERKLNNMYKVFISAGKWEPPDLIGLCEIENKTVLYGLIKESPFSYYSYRFLHQESPDRRGIDVALLYNPSSVEVIRECYIPVQFSEGSVSKTRDILYAIIKTKHGDTLSVFVNHWPSKYGGAGVTADLRESVAGILADSIYESLLKNPLAKIIVMGDFNDPPESRSMSDLTRKYENFGMCKMPLLRNLSENYAGSISGSYKYDGSWSMIDQFLVSDGLYLSKNRLYADSLSFSLYSADFLLERDVRFGGVKPFRTYAGMEYQGGFSDHLPIILDLFLSEL